MLTSTTVPTMNAEDAIALVETLLQLHHLASKLSNLQSLILQRTWEGKTYRAIAEESGYQHDYVKQVGSQLWRLVSQAVGQSVSKHNIRSVLHRYYRGSTHAKFSTIKKSRKN